MYVETGNSTLKQKTYLDLCGLIIDCLLINTILMVLAKTNRARFAAFLAFNLSCQFITSLQAPFPYFNFFL